MAPKFGTPVVVGPNVGAPAGLTGTAPGSGPGVRGTGKDGDGIDGYSDSGDGVFGSSSSGAGVSALSKTGPGLWATSETGEGLHTEIFSSSYAVAAYNRMANPLPGLPVVGPFGAEFTAAGGAIYGEATYGHAGYFVGKVRVVGHHEVSGNLSTGGNHSVNGDITAIGDIKLAGQDCAEHFDIAELEPVEAGMVMVLGEAGSLQKCRTAYDRKVVGVVSGAGRFKSAVILGWQQSNEGRTPIALSGKVFCQVDAEYGAVEVGDLLTTSDTPGHAMKATDPTRAFGAVLGKAISPLAAGRALIPVVVGLL